MGQDVQPNATVVITTKNRKDDLRRAVASVIAQTVPVELIVIDDGSTDGTSELIRSEFPQVRLVRSEKSQGLMPQRNRGAQLARGSIIFSLDDDAEMSPTTVAQTLADFNHPRVGAVAIPWIDVPRNRPMSHPPDARTIYATGWFIGTSHAVRRDIFLKLGGYEELIKICEEACFCMRMLNAGYVVRLGNAAVIHHYESPLRDLRKQHVKQARYVVMTTWLNVPLPRMAIQLPGTMFNVLRYRIREGYAICAIKGLSLGLWDCLRHIGARRPVTRRAYRLYRELVRRNAIPLEEIEGCLVPL